MSQVNQFVQQFLQPLKRLSTSRNPRAYTLGLTPYRQKQWQQAVECFTQATIEQPGHAPSHFKLGMSHFRLKEYEAALSAMTRALELDPIQKQWQEQLDQTARHVVRLSDQTTSEKEQAIRDQIELLDNPSAMLYNELAHTLRKQGKWWQEVEALKSAIEIEDHHPSWHYRLGEAQEVMNRYQQAAEAYGEAIKQKTNKAEAQWYYLQGYCFASEGHDGPANLQAAEGAYATAIEKDTKLNAQRFGIGVFHQQRGYWLSAKEAYQHSLDQQPWDAELNYRLGMAHDRCYEWAEAEECFKKALTIDTQQPNWHYRLGFVLERQEKYAEAALAYQYAALNRDRHTPYWFYRWGHVLEMQGKYKEAVNAYLQTRLQPALDKPVLLTEPQYEDDNSYTEGGKLSSEESKVVDKSSLLKDYAEQFSRKDLLIESLEGCLVKDTTNPKVWFQLGNAYERDQQWGKAAEAYQHAVKRENKHTPTYYYRLGYVLSHVETYESACDALKNIRIIQQAHGVSEKPFDTSKNFRLICSYSEYYENLAVKDKTILFESFNGNSLTCNPLGVFEKMIDDPSYSDWDFIWVLNDVSRIPAHYKSHKNISYIEKGSDNYLRAIATAKYLVNNSGFPPYFIRKTDQKYLATWHGTPLKTLGKEQKYKFFDHKRTQRNFLQATHIISPNKHTTNVLLDSYDIRHIYKGEIAELGYPRIDLTVNTTKSESIDIKNKLGLDSNKKVTLYAPTWRGTLQDISFDTEKLKADIEQLSATDTTVLFRGHSLLEEILREVNIGCVVVPSDVDSNKLLSIVDVLITDYSSIFFDFINKNKPIIYYTYDVADYERDRGLYFKPEEMPGKNFSTIEEVVKEIRCLCENDYFYLSGYDIARKEFSFLDDGKASERTVDFFINDSKDFVVDHNLNGNIKNIAFFAGGFEPNGITSSFINLLSEIDRDKINPVILFSPNGVEYSEAARESFDKLDYVMDYIPRFGNVLMTLEERYLRLRSDKIYYNKLSIEEKNVLDKMYRREFKRIVGESRFDGLVHFSGYDNFWCKVFASVDYIKNKSIYLHNDLYSEYKEKYSYLNMNFSLYQNFEKLVSVSKLTAELNQFNLSNRYGINSDKFIYCDNVHRPRFVIDMSCEPLLSNDEVYFSKNKTFITMGRLSSEKDHRKLLNAFKAVNDKDTETKLLILGEGPLRHELKSWIVDYEMSNSVFLLGRRDNPFPLLKKADCFVLSSNHEGQPMVLFEAMILDKPIISTDIVGSRSVIEGRSGHLVDNTVESLAQGMQDFLNNEIEFKYFDLKKYNESALNMFYDKVC